MREIRDMNKLINELESHENDWKHTASAARNRLLLKKWKAKIQVLKIKCCVLFMFSYNFIFIFCKRVVNFTIMLGGFKCLYSDIKCH